MAAFKKGNVKSSKTGIMQSLEASYKMENGTAGEETQTRTIWDSPEEQHEQQTTEDRNGTAM